MEESSQPTYTNEHYAIGRLMERVNQLEASLCELQNVVYHAHDMQVTIQGVIDPKVETYSSYAPPPKAEVGTVVPVTTTIE